MIISLSMTLAVVIGFSIERAIICMVKAVAEILTTHRAFMLISFAKTILWIELVTIPLTWLYPDVRANRHILGFAWAAVTGGFVFGIGAAVNRACAISILSRLGEGDLSMLLTIAAMLFGAAIAANMAGLSNSAIQQPLANLDEPSIAAACFLIPASAWAARDVWRLWRAWPQGAIDRPGQANASPLILVVRFKESGTQTHIVNSLTPYFSRSASRFKSLGSA
jgi:uncharacterized membrane protein YedE/YeeE